MNGSRAVGGLGRLWLEGAGAGDPAAFARIVKRVVVAVDQFAGARFKGVEWGSEHVGKGLAPHRVQAGGGSRLEGGKPVQFDDAIRLSTRQDAGG